MSRKSKVESQKQCNDVKTFDIETFDYKKWQKRN